MFLENTPTYSKIKKIYGKSNQYINTALIALDHFSKSDMENTLGDSVTWDPINKKESVKISKIFIRKIYLTVITDMIDSYLKDVVKSNLYLFHDDFIKGFNGCRGVRDRVNFFCQEYYSIKRLLFSFVDLVISWRNKIAHLNSESSITKENRNTLQMDKNYIYKYYSNMDIDLLLQNFDHNGNIKYKELISLNSASIEFLNEVDKEILKKFDLSQFLDFVKKEVSIDKNKFNNLLNQNEIRKSNYVMGIMENYGFKKTTNKKYEENDRRNRFKVIEPISVNVSEIYDTIFK